MSFLLEIPTEILFHILHTCDSDIKEITRTQLVCHRFHDLIYDVSFKAAWLQRRHGKKSALASAIVNSINSTLKVPYHHFLNEQVALLLLSHGTDPHAIKDVALTWAACKDYRTLFDELLAVYIPPPLPGPNLTRGLPWAIEVLSHSISPVSREIYPALLSYFDGDRIKTHSPLDMAFQAACAVGHDDILRTILFENSRRGLGLDIDSSQSFPIRISAWNAHAHPATLDLLLSHGALTHYELLPLCLNNALLWHSEDDFYRTLYVRLLDLPTRIHTSSTDLAKRNVNGNAQLCQMHNLNSNGAWSPLMIRLVSLGCCTPNVVLDISLDAASRGQAAHARDLLATLPKRHPALDLGDAICAHLLADPAARLDYDAALAFVADCNHTSLFEQLLRPEDPAAPLFRLPWCARHVHAVHPTPHVNLILAQHGIANLNPDTFITREPLEVIADGWPIEEAETETIEILEAELREYLKAVPHASRQSCLDRALCRRVQGSDTRGFRLLRVMGGNSAGPGMDTLLWYAEISAPDRYVFINRDNIVERVVGEGEYRDAEIMPHWAKDKMPRPEMWRVVMEGEGDYRRGERMKRLAGLRI